MTAAIFGLIGVIVGGCLNGAVAWLVERAKRRAELRTSGGRVVERDAEFVDDGLYQLFSATWPKSDGAYGRLGGFGRVPGRRLLRSQPDAGVARA